MLDTFFVVVWQRVGGHAFSVEVHEPISTLHTFEFFEFVAVFVDVAAKFFVKGIAYRFADVSAVTAAGCFGVVGIEVVKRFEVGVVSVDEVIDVLTCGAILERFGEFFNRAFGQRVNDSFACQFLQLLVEGVDDVVHGKEIKV